ncbi:MAG: PIN domain-containing protein [Chloroflexota bacterium]
MNVFVDTSALLAFLDADDAGHARALRGRDAIEGSRLVTHGYVVMESLALIRRRLGPIAARRFIDELLPALDIIDPDAELRSAIVESWRTELATTISFVDHASFVIMRRSGLTRAWALDADFRQAGFELVA